ncbi:acyl-CoA dehydrogenase [Nitrospirillum viridazoti Y2]|uniref:3-sulfinopropanoyl-CoA desulfinase n=1 Tax=Nitrospirillum amazonense TaxID=28077 RepID=A0A560HNF1_9PROT|nr:acyl-CoA dehydrogenase family protein [Nitrospirillum amazonense]EGY02648.1 acyl-CoA dehydrogenase [Nitrospirillum amazonense Y2]TWB46814.1 acyl-CoA dehydrogenase [Nitrospirillum amazonense]
MSNVLERITGSLRLTDEERMLIEAVERVAADTIGPDAARYDREASFPVESMAAINQLGLNAMFVPEAYGGAQLSFAAYLACLQIVSGACAATGITWATNFHAMKPLIDFGTEEQKRRLLPRIAEGGLAALAITEPEAGSDATGMRTRFTPDGDDIIVDGGKIFISNGDRADLYLLFGKWSGIENPRKAISVLILEKGTPGFEVLGVEHKMGHRGSSTATLSFSGCRVSRANLIGEPGSGLPILFASLNKSRPSIAAHSLGIAKAAFAKAVKYVNERKQSGRRIIDNQAIQFMIADLATDIAMADCFLWRLAAMIDNGETDFATESSMAKMRASDVAMKVTDAAVQLHGGYGYCQEYEVERLMRDAKINQIWEGTNQIHRQLIGRAFAEKDT